MFSWAPYTVIMSKNRTDAAFVLLDEEEWNECEKRRLFHHSVPLWPPASMPLSIVCKIHTKVGSGRLSNRQSASTRKHSTFFSHRICGAWESAKRVGHGKDWIGTIEATERNCLINRWILCFSIRTVRSVGPVRHSVAVPFGKSASEGRHKQIINCEKLIPNWLSVRCTGTQ